MFKKQTLLFLALYASVRIFSYFFYPGTIINQIVTGAILLFTIYYLLRHDVKGWYIVAFEIMLGGSGNFLSLFNFSLRTWLLITSILICTFQKLISKELKTLFKNNKKYCYILAFIYFCVALAVAHGFYFHHNVHAVISDALPYLFLLYYFPLTELLNREDFKSIASSALIAAIIGNATFALFTFIGFSGGQFILQDTYYHWFRDVANGKITDLRLHFYRIVLNEQLLIVPLIVYYVKKIIDKKIPATFYLLLATLLIALSINLTRIYFIALIIGLLFLFNRTQWKRWLGASFFSFLFFIFSFSSIHLAASRGQSFGLELFGLRLQSIVSPQIEDSSLSRMLLLPKILDKIKTHPVLGGGLGDTVTVFSPVIKQTITTTQFDWGYLEIIDELGFIGLVAWLSLIAYIFILSFRPSAEIWFRFGWPTASLATVMVMTLTSPALFHVLGIVWLSVIATLISYKPIINHA